MSAIGRDIAAAIVSDSNLATWSQVALFERIYVPREDLESTAAVVVSVVYSGQRMVPDSRSSWRHEYDIDVGIQKKFVTDQNTESDAQTDFLDEIIDYWKTRKPTGTSAVLIGGEWLNPYVPEHMTLYKQFTGVARLTFRLVRAN